MTTFLIFEGNSPELVAQGHSGSAGFVHSLTALAPQAQFRLSNAHDHESISQALFEGVDGVVFTGAGVAWSTDAPEAAPQRAVMEAALKAGLPIWGSCNGLQLAAVVLGGATGASPNGIEVGFANDIQLTDAGQKHPMMRGRSSGFAAPCIHRDEVQRLPEGAVRLAGNAHSPVQAMAYEVGGVCFWGSQYHPELGPVGIADYLRAKGIFDGHRNLVADLDAAETDTSAAARLGVSCEQAALSERSRELANWVARVTGG